MNDTPRKSFTGQDWYTSTELACNNATQHQSSPFPVGFDFLIDHFSSLVCSKPEVIAVALDIDQMDQQI